MAFFVAVTDTPAVEVADHAMALLLAWNRKLFDYDQFIRQGRWNQRSIGTGIWVCGLLSRLSQFSLGLWGFGRSGQAVAQRARAFGMTVLAHTRRPDPGRARESGVELVSQQDLLRCSDMISLHLPLTPENRHIVNIIRRSRQ